MEFLLYLVIAFIFAFIGATMATSRGRSPILWAIVCALFPLIGVVILLIIGQSNDAPTPPPAA